MKILLPVVLPLLLFAFACFNLVFNALGRQPFAKKSDRFKRIFLRRDVDMDKGAASVLFQKLLVNQVNVGNFPRLFFKIAVIFNIYSVGYDHCCNIARPVNVLGSDADFYFCPFAHLPVTSVFNIAAERAGRCTAPFLTFSPKRDFAVFHSSGR